MKGQSPHVLSADEHWPAGKDAHVNLHKTNYNTFERSAGSWGLSTLFPLCTTEEPTGSRWQRRLRAFGFSRRLKCWKSKKGLKNHGSFRPETRTDKPREPFQSQARGNQSKPIHFVKVKKKKYCISMPLLQLGITVWLSSSQTGASRSVMNNFQKVCLKDASLSLPLPYGLESQAAIWGHQAEPCCQGIKRTRETNKEQQQQNSLVILKPPHSPELLTSRLPFMWGKKYISISFKLL